MKGQQLKNSILQWAIQGKLVPQDPNDKPASVLLDKIRAKKEQLIKEKKIKKSKDDSVIFRGADGKYYERILATNEMNCIDEDIPFEIPNTWEWCRLSQVCNMSPKVKCDDETNVAFMPMKMIDSGYTSSYTYEIRKWQEVNKGFSKISTGDIAFAKITPCFQNRKSFILGNVEGGTAAATSEMRVIRLHKETIHPWYMLYFLKSSYFIDEAKFNGTAGQQRVLPSYVKDKLFPLPPLSEQKRIVEKLENILRLADEYATAQESLDNLNNQLPENLRNSILQHAIEGKLVPQVKEEGSAKELLAQINEEKKKLYEEGKLKKKGLVTSTIFKDEDGKYYEKAGKTVTCIDKEIPFDIPDSWEWTRMGEVLTMKAGKNIKAALISPEKTLEHQYKCFGGNGIRGYVNSSNNNGTHVLIGRQGALCGNVKYVKGEFYATEHAVVVTPKIEWNLRYLYYMLERMNLNQYATSTAQPGLAVSKIATTFIPVPPLNEQNRIVKKIELLLERVANLSST